MCFQYIVYKQSVVHIIYIYVLKSREIEILTIKLFYLKKNEEESA